MKHLCSHILYRVTEKPDALHPRLQGSQYNGFLKTCSYAYAISSHKNGHVTAHLTDKECIHLRYSIIPFRQSCSWLLQELGTSMASGFSPSDLWRSSELAMYFCTHISPRGHHISHTPLALQRDICLQDVRLRVICLSWLWIYCEIFCAEILWPELNILLCSVLQLTSAVESDICKESNAIVTMHFFSHQVYGKLLFRCSTADLSAVETSCSLNCIHFLIP